MLILKNNFLRLSREKSYGMLTIIVLLVMIIASAYFVTMKAPTAEIGVGSSASELMSSNLGTNKIHFKKVTKNGDYYQNLILGRYDAYITKNKKGNYQVTTIRNTALKSRLTALLNHHEARRQTKFTKSAFKTLCNVLGLSTMMLAIILTKFYFDDRDQMDKRIFLSGATTVSYIMQNWLFIFLVLFVISTVFIAIILPIFEIKLSPTLFVINGLINLFAASFGLILATLTANNEGTLSIGTMITSLTLLLSGAFFTIKKRSIQSIMQYLCPQHYIADLGKYLDGSKHLILAIVCLLTYSVLFMIISLSVQKKRVEK